MNETISIRSAILSCINGKPSLISPKFQHVVTDMLKEKAVISGNGFCDEGKKQMAAFLGGGGYDYSRSYLYADGIAYIPVHGLLMNRLTFSGWGVTGYDYIRGAVNEALGDRDVRGIVFDVNSPGGSAQGCFELADYIRSVRKEKPSMAMVNANACSGGYALASAAGKVIAIKSADIGSIGVYSMHVDYSKWMDEIGISIEFIYAGEHKVDGNPYEPLTDAVRKEIQASVNDTYEQFVSLVATNRSIDKQAAIDTQAKVLSADEAASVGLIDSVAGVDEALVAFKGELSGSGNPTTGVNNMANETQAGNEISAETLNATVASEVSKALAADRQRRKDITTCDEAKGREQLAAHLADSTVMTAEEAKGVLAASPKKEEKAAAGAGNAFAQAMDTTTNPDVPNNGGDDQAAANRADKLVAAGRKAGVLPAAKK